MREMMLAERLTCKQGTVSRNTTGARLMLLSEEAIMVLRLERKSFIGAKFARGALAFSHGLAKSLYPAQSRQLQSTWADTITTFSSLRRRTRRLICRRSMTIREGPGSLVHLQPLRPRLTTDKKDVTWRYGKSLPWLTLSRAENHTELREPAWSCATGA